MTTSTNTAVSQTKRPDLIKREDLEQLRRDSVPIRALIGINRHAPKTLQVITLSATNRPNPCYGYGHQGGCPRDEHGNIHGQRSNIVRWNLIEREGVAWIEGYRV